MCLKKSTLVPLKCNLAAILKVILKCFICKKFQIWRKYWNSSYGQAYCEGLLILEKIFELKVLCDGPVGCYSWFHTIVSVCIHQLKCIYFYILSRTCIILCQCIFGGDDSDTLGIHVASESCHIQWNQAYVRALDIFYL